MNEQAIVLRCQQGETGLLDDLVQMHEDSLFRFCFYLTRNPDGAAELFQDTWLKAMKSIKKYKARGSFLGWLFSIAANLHRDKYRRRKVWQNIMIRQQIALARNCLDDPMVKEDLRIIIRQALELMDESLRVPVMLYYFEGYTHDAIADILGVPVGTVKSRLYRARKHLRNRLEVLE